MDCIHEDGFSRFEIEGALAYAEVWRNSASLSLSDLSIELGAKGALVRLYDCNTDVEEIDFDFSVPPGFSWLTTNHIKSWQYPMSFNDEIQFYSVDNSDVIVDDMGDLTYDSAGALHLIIKGESVCILDPQTQACYLTIDERSLDSLMFMRAMITPGQIFLDLQDGRGHSFITISRDDIIHQTSREVIHSCRHSRYHQYRNGDTKFNIHSMPDNGDAFTEHYIQSRLAHHKDLVSRALGSSSPPAPTPQHTGAPRL